MSVSAKHFINLLSPYIHSYGYWVAFLGMTFENMGIPVPGETALIVVVYYAAKGVLNIWIVLPLAIIGDIVGDSIGYAIGRFGGRPLVDRWGRLVRLDERKVAATERLFKEKGGRTVFGSQFSSVTRLTGSIAAGLSHMPYKKFLFYDSAAAAVLIALVGGATYYFGANLDSAFKFFHGIRTFALVGFAVFASIMVARYYEFPKKISRRQLAKIIVIVSCVSIAIGLIYYTVAEYLLEII